MPEPASRGGGGSAPGEGVCSVGGGVCSWGVSAPGRGVCSQGVGCLLPGVSAPGGVSALGVSAWGCGIPACTEADTPRVNRMTDRYKNITLATTSLRPVKIKAITVLNTPEHSNE